MAGPHGFWKKWFLLTGAGGTAFWLANFAISRTPIAAWYRAGLSIEYVPMLFEALAGGLLIGAGVTAALLRFHDRLPGGSPLGKTLLLSTLALVLLTGLVEAPGKFLTGTPQAGQYFLVAAGINAIRLFALGSAIGFLYKKVNGEGKI
jgi:hypothetical protein